MKILPNQFKSSLFSNSISRKRFVRNQVSKVKKRYKARIRNYFLKRASLQKVKTSAYRKTLSFRSSDTVYAPSRLSFIDNTDEVLSFLKKISVWYEKRQQTFLNFERVEFLSHDALVILLSFCRKFREDGIVIDGNYSLKSSKVNQLIRESGFIDELYRSPDPKNPFYALKRRLIKLRANNEVKAEQSSQLIEDASKHIWGIPRRCRGVQKACVELMQNTNNHASPGEPGGTRCWISTNYDPARGVVSFTILDFGVGVFESLRDKPTESKWFGWFEKLAGRFSFDTDADILNLILNGELHRTVTGEYFRGKGLPALKSCLDRNQLGNLIIITNGVKADVAKKSYTMMTNSFRGTFVYWELSKDNKSDPFIFFD